MSKLKQGQCECGSKMFRSEPDIAWYYELDENNNLTKYGEDVEEPEKIICSDCGLEYSLESFNSIRD